MITSNEHMEFPSLSSINYFDDREAAVQYAIEALKTMGSFHALTTTITPGRSGESYVVTVTSLWSADTEITLYYKELRNI
jgi:hypothetical protein